MADKEFTPREGYLVDSGCANAAAAGAGDITVTPANSPYNIPGPTADYNSITIQPGGFLQLESQTAFKVKTLTKT